MACFKPLDAAREIGAGKRPLIYKHGRRPSNPAAGWEHLLIPCGQCIGCRADKAKEWALRCIHEASLHEANSWVTLTYDPEHLPYGGDLHPPDLQRFLKRLRRKTPPIRFYGCGEYGDQLDRPHYHICIFGYDFPDKTYWRSQDDFNYHRSALLESCWKLGNSEVTDLTIENAGYTARYCMKKITGQRAGIHYEKLVESTGEIIQLHPEFARMSNRPGGIGANWYETYQRDTAKDFVTHNGKKYSIPAYYDRLFQRVDPQALEVRKRNRQDRAAKHAADQTPQRLGSRESCFRAKLANLDRGYETQSD